MSKEISNLQIAVNDPPRPYIAILGGTKCDDSLKVAKNLIDKEIIDTIPVVGVVGNMMLWASGVDIGEGNKSFIRNAQRKWRNKQNNVRGYKRKWRFRKN
jgi:phosphoglycerate kinase